MLSDAHQQELNESLVSDAHRDARGYRTVTDEKELTALGFAPKQRLIPGLLLPSYAPDGSNGLYQFKPDYPRQARNRQGELTDGVVKYETPKGAGMRLDVPPLCRSMLKDPSITIWITEGIKKGDCLASHGLCAVVLLGVWNYKGKNDLGGVAISVDFDSIAWNGREVRIVFDSDVMHKPGVRQALDRLTEILQRRGAHVSIVYLPGGRDKKVGVDDFLREHTLQELEALVDAPRPEPQPAPPVFELMDSPPDALKRPLAKLGSRGYAAAWPYIRKTETETKDQKSGRIIKHDPPIVTQEQRLYIVRDDGATFGDGGRFTFDDLGFTVSLSEIPPNNKLWSAGGVRAFAQGQRPDALEVFNRVADVVDCFIDFDKSLADQRTMAELIACYIMATWFLDAFTVIGFIWPNGEKAQARPCCSVSSRS
jgi:hypothetical protein